jgi:osmotically-inducible protein OsmY
MKTLNRFVLLALAIVMSTIVACASTDTQQGAGGYVDDSVVTTKVKAAVFNEPTLKSAEINVETFKGVVQLSGFVNSEADIKKAVDVASKVKGVVSVKNDMRLKTTP